jgi:two-component system phosphate regulon response regulator PhoB
MKSILLVDDEPIIARAQINTLRSYGFAAELAETIEAAYMWIDKTHFDLILIDVNLQSTARNQPNGGLGIDLVRGLRARKITTPVLMYTVMEGDLYETAALNAGADDYILKKSSMPRLLTTLYAHLRRTARGSARIPGQSKRIPIGRFLLDAESHILSADETPIHLTTNETRILEVLAASPARTVPTQELIDRVWGSSTINAAGPLEAALCRLRQKLKEHCIENVIESVRGSGFRLNAPKLRQSSSR